MFGKGLLKKAPFGELIQGLSHGEQARTVIDVLFRQFVSDTLKLRWGLLGTAKLLLALDENNSLCEQKEKRWGDQVEVYTVRATDYPIFC